jgi:hypothetical protein
MPPTDPATILLAHDRWATGQVIDRCRALTGERFHQSFEMGLGSLHGTLAHVISAMRGWGDLLADRPQREPLDTEGPFSCDQLSSLLDAVAHDFAAHAPPVMDPAEVVSGERNGRTWSFTRGVVRHARDDARDAPPGPVREHAAAAGRRGPLAGERGGVVDAGHGGVSRPTHGATGYHAVRSLGAPGVSVAPG